MKIIENKILGNQKHKNCPLQISIDVYNGCNFNCLYCISGKSFKTNLSTNNGLEKLKYALEKNKEKYPVYLSPWTDPYPKIELKKRYAREILEFISKLKIPFYIVSKSEIVSRDTDIFQSCNNYFVAISINSPIESFIKRYEVNTPTIKSRINLLKKLTYSGVKVVVKIDPLLPFLNDNEKDLDMLIKMVHDAGVTRITADVMRIKICAWKRIERLIEPEIRKKYVSLYNIPHNIGTVKEALLADLSYRVKLLEYIKNKTDELGIHFATCRATLPEGFCDADCRGGF